MTDIAENLDSLNATDFGIEESADEPLGRRDELSDKLLDAIDRLKVSSAAVTKVISVADDPNASAKDLAHAIEFDPAFTAQIIRLANSAYYGMSGRVGNTNFAVTVIGFSTVRSLATLAASGVNDSDWVEPADFWQHAAASAAAASSVARQFGINPNDAFAAGLLHDLGSAILYNIDATAHKQLSAKYGNDGKALNDAERRTFGIGHDEAVGRVLAQWQLPPDFVRAVRTHHSRERDSTCPFSLALRAADYLAEAAFDQGPSHHRSELLAMGISESLQSELTETTRVRSQEIIDGLLSG